MKDLRFLLSREWLGYLAFLIVFGLVCLALSNWQFARRDEAAHRNAVIAANWDAPAQPLADVLAGDAMDETQRYQSVTITGSYRASDQLLVRNRVYNGQTGYEQLVPLVDDSTGRILIIDRGWIASSSQGDVPETLPSIPTGTVTVVARLNMSEQSLGRDSPTGQVASISVTDIVTTLGLDASSVYASAYGLLASESPGTADTPSPAQKPSFDEGMHLSYAFQWIAFALLGVIGFVYALRTTRRHQREDAADVEAQESDARDGASYGRRRSLPAPRRTHDSDAAYEDAVLDAQGDVPQTPVRPG
ncbi:MAG TPA: SURF1 family protein [Pseudoclavibacter sp.]|nr:SURF1 family protein [Pseudoclavibacter sp.]